MEFTLAFGAVGDFIAVISLIKDIITALDDSRGSVKDYRDVVRSFEVLQRTVQHVSQIYDDMGTAKDLGDLRILAMSSVSQIQQSLEGFRDRNRKFERSLGGGGAKNVFRDVVRKIRWNFEEKDVMKIRDEMKGYTASLSMLLDITTIRLMQRNHEVRAIQAADNEDRTAVTIRKSSQVLKQYAGAIGQRILSKLSFIAGLGVELRQSTSGLMPMMVSLSGELSGIKAILMRLERPLNDEHFILEDITGRAFPIHLKTITSWDAFEFILADRFRGKKGAHRVKGNRYSLQERASHRQIDRSTDWEGAFLPYQRIDMSLICREAGTGPQKKSSMSCPWCQTVAPVIFDTETQW
ncbi:hypothetical protein CGLO_16799 [Colletotrichum gloeosporioides Cg-14]|uniref:Ubiquitin-like domain-containing protein n=1 Tax=Colletotrichum gloeosporioides (strain Cg-14) TaxID=1237896 RepID=T0L8I7_COLGC|nr:hypothetical protein CGLO_16799 [Colletotrichum gloeosporioides Cg-14]